MVGVDSSDGPMWTNSTKGPGSAARPSMPNTACLQPCWSRSIPQCCDEGVPAAHGGERSGAAERTRTEFAGRVRLRVPDLVGDVARVDQMQSEGGRRGA